MTITMLSPKTAEIGRVKNYEMATLIARRIANETGLKVSISHDHNKDGKVVITARRIFVHSITELKRHVRRYAQELKPYFKGA